MIYKSLQHILWRKNDYTSVATTIVTVIPAYSYHH